MLYVVSEVLEAVVTLLPSGCLMSTVGDTRVPWICVITSMAGECRATTTVIIITMWEWFV